VRNNIYALYLGCVAALVGGLGTAYESLAPSGRHETPAAPTTASPRATDASSSAQTPAQWPPDNAAVAFHDEMLELLAPKTQPAMTMYSTAAPIEPDPQPAAQSRETVREVAPEPRSQRRSSRRQQRRDDARDDRRLRDDAQAGDDGRRVVTEQRARDRDEIEVLSRDRRRYRIDRRDRADSLRDARRYREEREPPPTERRAPPGGLFGIFGPFGSDQ